MIAVVVILGAAFWLLGDQLKQRFLNPDPTTIAQSSLQGLREQNRLSTFAARYVAVVTSKQSRLGLTAQKTLIMPGSVRYEVDLARLQQNDVSWDPTGKKLTVVLPPVEVVGPEVDMEHIREYSEGGILMTLTDAESALDDANRKAARAELVRQAQEPTPMKMARESTRRAVAKTFEMPLKAAGIDASVQVYFQGEPRNGEVWDMSTNPRDIGRDRPARERQ
ncbi:MAG: DUF4230 domain-containing protein [Sphingomonas sp.]|nr:DUF4230 domain-containing protein [Sphingomonas sp.]